MLHDPVLPELLAVIGRDNDKRIIIKPAAFETVENRADQGVGVKGVAGRRPGLMPIVKGVFGPRRRSQRQRPRGPLARFFANLEIPAD